MIVENKLVSQSLCILKIFNKNGNIRIFFNLYIPIKSRNILIFNFCITINFSKNFSNLKKFILNNLLLFKRLFSSKKLVKKILSNSYLL